MDEDSSSGGNVHFSLHFPSLLNFIFYSLPCICVWETKKLVIWYMFKSFFVVVVQETVMSPVVRTALRTGVPFSALVLLLP